MNNFFFHNPAKILFGRGMVDQIGEVLSNNSVSNLLILFGQGSVKKHGYLNKVISDVESKGINHIVKGNITPNPTIAHVNEAIAVSREHRVDAVLAIGGGSVIDTAKAVAVGHYYHGDVWELFENKTEIKMALPIYTIVTLSATASEMNAEAVITHEAERKKWSFAAGSWSTPKVSIIDPELQFTLPEMQTVNGAIDSISHVLEYYFNGVKNVDIQDEISEGLMRTIMKHVRILLNNPYDYESRAQLAWCTTLAFNGINATGRFGGDFATHSMEHSLSAFYPDIAHARGLAVLFPHWMQYVFMHDLEKFVKFSTNIFSVPDQDKASMAMLGIHQLRAFYNELNAPSRLRELGVTKNRLHEIAENVVMKGPVGRLKKLNKGDVMNILEMAY